MCISAVLELKSKEEIGFNKAPAENFYAIPK